MLEKLKKGILKIIEFFRMPKKLKYLEVSFDAINIEYGKLLYERDKIYQALIKEQEKKDRASKKIAELIKENREIKKRRDEVITRLQSKIPDDVLGGHFSNYKYWIAEPLIKDKYESYTPPNDREVYVDKQSLLNELPEFIGIVEDNEKEGKITEVQEEGKG